MKKRSKFNLSHYKLFTCDMGQLIPCGLVEVLPGDTFQHAVSALIRVSPLLAPVMHPIHVRMHSFFVPHRLVWDSWEKFITGGPDGMDASVFPTMAIDDTQNVIGALGDYLGVPTNLDATVSALPYRGYSLIWNEFFRDQDLETPLVVSTASGNDTTTNRILQHCDWEKDYFTTSRPWTQKGPQVTIPLTGTAPVLGIGKINDQFLGSGVTVRESDQTTSVYANAAQINPASPNTEFAVESNPDASSWPFIRADLSSSTAVQINELRLALALQRYEEARARYGSRYTEYLAYLGVRSSDARLQRPEYLGGGKQTIQVSEVLQTSPTTDGDDTDGVGNIKGHGLGAMRSNRYRRFFEEHGYVFTLFSVRPRTMYVQGLSRTWNRRTKEDFWQKELEHIGQQEVLNKELYLQHATPEGIFGYQNRYDEYRRAESYISGEFRNTLDYWHMARIFASDPALNASFVVSVPTKRIHASTDAHALWVMTNHSLQARRQLSRTGSSFTF